MARIKLLFENSFVRNVSVLACGTALAQALALLSLPLLTRLYSPEEFGVLGVFVALLGMISVMANLRYEIAIPLPESDQSAANLLAVSLACGAATTLTVGFAVALFRVKIAQLMGAPLLAGYLWLLPIGVAVTSAYAVFQLWATRKKAFLHVARTRVEQAVGGVFTQVLLGWAGAGAWGLIVGQIVSNGAGFFGLARRARKEEPGILLSVNLVGMKAVAREYDRLPKFSAVEAFSNTAAVQLPLIVIASFATSAEVGYLMLGMRLMQAPVGLIGSSVSQVYFSRAVEEHRDGNLAQITARSVANLAKIGVGPLVFAGIIAPAAFGIIFGKDWQRAGELVAWMTPWFVFQFLSSPVSMALQVTLNQPKALALHAFGLVFRSSMVILPSYILNGALLSESYAISGFIFYVAYLMVIFRVAKVSLGQVSKIVFGAIPFVVPWFVIGFGVRAWL